MRESKAICECLADGCTAHVLQENKLSNKKQNETNKLKINRKYVPFSVRVSNQNEQKIYGTFLLAIEGKEYSGKKISLGAFFITIFFLFLLVENLCRCSRFPYIFFLCMCPIPSIDNGNNSIEDKVQETEKLPNLWTTIIAFHRQTDSKCARLAHTHTKMLRDERTNWAHTKCYIELKYDKHAEIATFITMAQIFPRSSFSNRCDVIVERLCSS